MRRLVLIGQQSAQWLPVGLDQKILQNTGIISNGTKGRLTHAWLLLAMIGAARRGGGRGKQGEQRKGLARKHAENRAFDHRVKNYQLNVRCCRALTPKDHGKCLSLMTTLLLAHFLPLIVHLWKEIRAHNHTDKKVVVSLWRKSIRVATEKLRSCDTHWLQSAHTHHVGNADNQE